MTNHFFYYALYSLMMDFILLENLMIASNSIFHFFNHH